MSRELLQARFDDDTVEQVEQYAEDTDITRSEALRRCVRTQLRKEGYRDSRKDQIDDRDGETLRAAISTPIITAVLSATLTVVFLVGFNII